VIVSQAKSNIKSLLYRFGWEVRRVLIIPDREAYEPLLKPERVDPRFQEIYQAAQRYTIVSEDRCYVLYTLARQAAHLGGDFVECGVYKGGTAMLLARVLDDIFGEAGPLLRLFDTFSGIPAEDPTRDLPKKRFDMGDFSDTTDEAVHRRIARSAVSFHKGLIPETFKGLEDTRIAFAHVDVVLHRAVDDCCRFIYPRLIPGGFMVFDDYGFSDCPGARAAIDQFFKDTVEIPLVLPTGQAVVFKSPPPA
jgi:O-methyltransferase